jgi:molybdopterin-binding protein
MACEYVFKDFYSRGSDEYINTWAAEVDQLAGEGWKILDSVRSQGKPFQWTVCLYRDTVGNWAGYQTSSRSKEVDDQGFGGYDCSMGISARNQLRGTISDIVLGNVMAHVTVQVGDNTIESMISRKSAEELHLKKGDAVVVIIKSTEVMIQKD